MPPSPFRSAQPTASPLSSVLLDPGKMVKPKSPTRRKIKVQKKKNHQTKSLHTKQLRLSLTKKLWFTSSQEVKLWVAKVPKSFSFLNQNWWILLRCLNLSNKPKYPYLKLSRAYFKSPRCSEVTNTLPRRCTDIPWFLLMERLGPVDGIRLQNCIPLRQGLPSTYCTQQCKLACIKTVLYQHWCNSFLKSSSLILLSRT